jgi:hypothetical protein
MEKDVTESEEQEQEQLMSRREFLQQKFFPVVALAVAGSIVNITEPDIAEAGNVPEFPVSREGTKAKIRWWTDEHFLKDMQTHGAQIYDTARAAHLRPKLKKFVAYMKKHDCPPLPQPLTGKLSIDYPMVMKHSEKDLIESFERWVDNRELSLRDADGLVNGYLERIIGIFELKEGDISWALKQFLRK